MPTIAIQIDSPGTTVTSPHTLPFTVVLNDASHANYPVYFRSMGARFTSSLNLPTKMEFGTSNLTHDPVHTTLTFPITSAGSPSPSFHFHSDFHLGEVSNNHTIQGFVKLYGAGTVQLPAQFSMILFVDSQYM